MKNLPKWFLMTAQIVLVQYYHLITHKHFHTLIPHQKIFMMLLANSSSFLKDDEIPSPSLWSSVSCLPTPQTFLLSKGLSLGRTTSSSVARKGSFMQITRGSASGLEVANLSFQRQRQNFVLTFRSNAQCSWSCKGIINWELLSMNSTVTAEVYYMQLDCVAATLCVKQDNL